MASGECERLGLIGQASVCWRLTLEAVGGLILIGDKDGWTPAALCTGMRDRANNEVVVYPGATHSFSYNPGIDYLGHGLRRRGSVRRATTNRRFHGRTHAAQVRSQ